MCIIIISLFSIQSVLTSFNQMTMGQETGVQYSNHVSEKYGLSIEIPSDASIEEGSEYDLIQMLTITMKDGSELQISMYPKEDAIGMDLKTYVDTLLNISISKTDDPILIKLISGPTQSVVGSEPAFTTTTSYIFAVTGKAYLVSQTYVLFHGNHLYLFDFRSTPDKIDLIQTIIQKMISSVKFS